MRVLKVVSVWYGCWHECGLIIWGFIHLGNCFDICYFFCSFFIEFGQNMGLFLINSINHLKSYLLCNLYHLMTYIFDLI